MTAAALQCRAPAAHAAPEWRLVHPVPPDLADATGRFAARRRSSLKHIVGDGDAREAMLAHPLRRDRICVAMIGAEIVGCLSYRLDGAGAIQLDRRRFRQRFGLISGEARYLATQATLRRGDPDYLYIEGFAVAAKARRLGIGQALLRWLGDEAARHGKQGWQAEMREGHGGTARLYERAGARPVRNIPLGPAALLFGARRMVLYRCKTCS
ncbi:GNAT family N-acetyltransferase [Rhodobacteraceae bacterium NNCM2]|nr:GNAT family N-acetyltransferase [Coraliihabitans acroporae]